MTDGERNVSYLFERLSNEDLKLDASKFAWEMEKFVERIGVLHWAIDRLSMEEFDVNSNNEWILKLQEVVFETIYRDAQAASVLVSSHEISLRKASSLDTMEAMRTVLRTELTKQGLSPHEVAERVREHSEKVETETERWRNRLQPGNSEAA